MIKVHHLAGRDPRVKPQVTPFRQASLETRHPVVPPAGIEPATRGLGNAVPCLLCRQGAGICFVPARRNRNAQ